MIDHYDYYSSYFGHEFNHLTTVHEHLRKLKKGMIFLAGDSSLDNKYWFNNKSSAINGYENILSPPIMKMDVCYWINKLSKDRKLSYGCINTAVEATTLSDRNMCNHLLKQDQFIAQNMTKNDILIVSIGGNDIALKPLICTIAHIIPLLCCTPQTCIQNGFTCPPNLHINCGCYGCGLFPDSFVGLCGCPFGLGYFVNLFKNHIENYIYKIISFTSSQSKKKNYPKKILVCMIYFPSPPSQEMSWADNSLNLLCYNNNPLKLQQLIKTMFELATKEISIPGCEVVPVPLFNVLDGTSTSDYLQRVEPSVVGGKKMASAFLDIIADENGGKHQQQGNYMVNGGIFGEEEEETILNDSIPPSERT